MIDDKHRSRRGFLVGLGVLGGGVALGARTATAFTVVDGNSMGATLSLAYSNRCGGSAEHAALQAVLDARLANQTGPQGTYLSDSMTCPVCGCPVTATRYIR